MALSHYHYRVRRIKRLGKSLESREWVEAYKSAELVGRRSSTYARKLQRLGLWRAESGPILDIACGTGEALCLLNSAGHQHLVGLDVDLDLADLDPHQAKLDFIAFHGFES